MFQLLRARWSILGLIMLTACVVEQNNIASTCGMELEVLDKRQSGPFEIEVIGTATLCLEADGDANLGPFTATARITNRGSTATTVHYRRGVASAFQSVSYWEKGRRDEVTAFGECCGEPQSGSIEQKTLAPGEVHLVSSWTRHHTAIWSEMSHGLQSISPARTGVYVVRFSLSLAYGGDSALVTLLEEFDVVMRADSS